MKKIVFLISLVLLLLGVYQKVFSHEVNYQIKNSQSVCISFFFTERDPMNFSEVEVYYSEEKNIFQKARTDRNGIFCFLPNKAGIWKVVAKGETEHGLHRAEMKIKVDKDMEVEDFKKPLVARYTKFFIALGVVGWLFGFTGIYLYFKK
ncbi:MAG: DUF4198 domain-containing protein [Thermodesulfovibrio sp.]|nr:DUF4198 domain-containing protein [Thermodesulfovibrio sp.]